MGDQMNIWKFIYLNSNWGECYGDMIDHHGYAHNLGSYEA